MKAQKRKVGVAGGFINQMMGNNATEPKIGEGATILMYSDRHAYEVVKVSKNGLECVIREMDFTFVGSGYGDERYTYSSNPENHTKNLEWNEKKGCWGEVYYTIEIIKALKNRLIKEFGWDWAEHLPDGRTYKSLIDVNSAEEPFYRTLLLVDGITKKYKNFNKVSIIFGVMERYQDPSF